MKISANTFKDDGVRTFDLVPHGDSYAILLEKLVKFRSTSFKT